MLGSHGFPLIQFGPAVHALTIHVDKDRGGPSQSLQAPGASPDLYNGQGRQRPGRLPRAGPGPIPIHKEDRQQRGSSGARSHKNGRNPARNCYVHASTRA